MVRVGYEFGDIFQVRLWERIFTPLILVQLVCRFQHQEQHWSLQSRGTWTERTACKLSYYYIDQSYMGQFYKRMEGPYVMKDFSWSARYASRPETLASYLDQLITSEHTIEEIIKAAQAKGKSLGQKTKFTKGTIHAHIRFRVAQASKNKAA